MSSKANRIPYRLCLISDQLLFTAISLDMSPSILFLHTNNFKIVTMSDVIKNLQSHSSEPQLHSSHQNITDEDDWKDWEDEDVVDSESSDIALKGSQSEIVGVVGTSDPLQETHNMLMIQAKTFRDFALWGGLVVRIKEGGQFEMRQKEIDGEWFPYFMESSWEGKLAMVKRIGDHYRLERYGFERGSADKPSVGK